MQSTVVRNLALVAVMACSLVLPGSAQPPKMKMTTDIP
jgi:hypothetical protein